PAAPTAVVRPDAVVPLDNPPVPAVAETRPAPPPAPPGPTKAELARLRIKNTLDRITSQRGSLPNEAFKVRLDLIAAKLATANEQMNADAVQDLLRECDAEDAVFREVAEFRQTSEVAI